MKKAFIVFLMIFSLTSCWNQNKQDENITNIPLENNVEQTVTWEVIEVNTWITNTWTNTTNTNLIIESTWSTPVNQVNADKTEAKIDELLKDDSKSEDEQINSLIDALFEE